MLGLVAVGITRGCGDERAHPCCRMHLPLLVHPRDRGGGVAAATRDREQREFEGRKREWRGAQAHLVAAHLHAAGAVAGCCTPVDGTGEELGGVEYSGMI